MLRIILASGSPRRKQLLGVLNLSFNIILPGVDESLYLPEGSPEEYCSLLAGLKADNVSRNNSESLVIGADTIVVIDSKIIGKPSDKADAVQMLKGLSGNTHTVHTAVALRMPSRHIKKTFVESTQVTFRDLSEHTINYYIDNHAPYDKAGSYGIQDFSAVFVKSLTGCYHNVMGFPISRFHFEISKLNLAID
ncbi:MAG: septum formation protein Maf [Candidatus Marinimicrobia bacterium]|nr:septum formation protein Maf [Candidatus Neomarinimicrobiota bacterium]MBT3634158.1 septum formation protein Maf [Candidatus Neomarinimicrobiota bacterium]MBT3683195.1 septum formation protein Maf [Candidatus Neomarinimicrobiota bacterium]MBT3759757.1 septum formation protein Maf [Candidatus Neomarinimicrobiota bacterium]MBT3895837.1 septum formation protein Maf [Candidatus Neomarinimicrobiota bacterium]